MPKLTQANFEAIRDHLFDRIHRTGEQAKNDLPNQLEYAIENEAWKHFFRPDGAKFKNIVEWMECTWPNGASLGQGTYAMNFDDVLKLTEGAPGVHRFLTQNAPKAMPGPKKTNGFEFGASTLRFKRREGRAHSAAVLSVRLAQEKSKYYDAYRRGEYRSVTAAAVAAGLIKADANLRRAKSAVGKMTESEFEQFEQWFKKWKRAKK